MKDSESFHGTLSHLSASLVMYGLLCPLDWLFGMSTMNSNDPVLHSLKRRLNKLNEEYLEKPDELNRYRLVSFEQLILRWTSGQIMDD